MESEKKDKLSSLYYNADSLNLFDEELKKEGKKEVIINMLKANMDIKEISEISGFSEYQVNEIKYNIEHFNNWD